MYSQAKESIGVQTVGTWPYGAALVPIPSLTSQTPHPRGEESGQMPDIHVQHLCLMGRELLNVSVGFLSCSMDQMNAMSRIDPVTMRSIIHYHTC